MRQRLSAVERFYKLTHENHITGCLEWTGSVGCTGKGQFHPDSTVNRPIYAPDFAYTVAVGPVPEGYRADPICGNPRCVSPNHLDLVRHYTRTKVARRLSKAERRSARGLYRLKEYTQQRIAEMFNVRTTVINRVVNAGTSAN